MAPPPTTPPAPGPPPPGPGAFARRARRRRIGRVLALVVVALAVVVGAAVALLGSETLLRTLVERGVGASGGRLAVESVTGSLLGTVRADRIVWHDGPLTVSVDDAEVAIDWRTLPGRRLRVRTVSATRVEVVTEPSGQPAALPASLALPIAVDVVDARVGELIVRQAGSDAPLHLSELRASARYTRPGWTLDALSLRGPFGALQAGGTIGDAAPYPLTARALLETRVLDEPVAVDATAGGTLTAIDAELRTVLRDASLSGRLRVEPLAPQPLAAVDATLGGLDLSRFGSGLPVTRLSGRLQATAPTAPTPGTGPPPVLPPLAGTLALRNAGAGTLDDRRIPLASADLRFAFDGARLRVDAFSLDGPAGRVDGDASLRLPAGDAAAALGAIEPTRPATLPEFELRARTDRLDLARLHGALRPTALRGTVRVAPQRGTLAFEGSLADGELALDARARFVDDRVTIERARLQARDGVAEFAGTAGTASPYRFDLSGSVSRLDPARFADVPPGLLNGRWRASGNAGPKPEADASVTLADSRWRGLALSGSAAGRWSPGRVREVDAALRLGGTTLTARGDLGAAGDRLAASVDATRLQELDPRVAGRATLDAELRDALLAPALAARLRARELRVADRLAVRSLQASAEVARPQALIDVLERLGVDVPAGVTTVAPGPATRGGKSGGPGARTRAVPATPPVATAGGAPLTLTVQAEGLRVDGNAVDSLRAELAGDADRHRFALRAGVAERRVDAALVLEGGLVRGEVAHWRGRVAEASNTGSPRLRLLAPADLAVSPDAVSAGPLQIEIDGADGARLRLDTARWQDGRLRVQGAVAGIPLRWLDPWVRERGVRTNEADALRMGARVDLSGAPGPGGDLRGVVEAFRESGDVTVEVPAVDGGIEPLRAGLQALDARVEIGDGRLAATFAVRGAAIGTLRGDARAPLAWTADGGLDTAVPLEGRLEASLPSLAFTRALAGDAWRFDGALQARLVLGGTLAAPSATGRIEGTRLAAEQRELGMRLVDGTLSATLRDNTLDIETMRFSSGKGSVTLTGSLRPDERSEAVLVLDRMPIPLGAGQRLSLTGEARATLRGGLLTLRGALRADEGVIELTANNAPRLATDIVVVRDAAEAARHRADARRRAEAGPVAPAAPGDGDDTKGFRIVSNLQIDLGERFRVFGAGVDARLEGQLTLRGRLPDAPRLTGTVRIVSGTYTGFGQKLEIERGNLVFSGPVDNPAIDIVAYRRYLPVEAGVMLTGTARAPRVALVSKPDVPEQEKLSWLVLGVGADTSRTGQQNAALSAAAATLLSSADPRLAQVPSIASTFGLDVVSVRTGQVGSSADSGSTQANAQDSIVTLGKRLTDRLFVSYEQSLRGLQNLLRLQYEITESLQLRLRAGTQNAVDLMWTWRYD